ncbi:hypothetical protein BDV33DRAFT_199187 [Aspergillus novoparasiticus]|uniref:MACPF-like domain-containing protein n=1 Tax=Aspergillus novoparasiticus TaxID=986946 RepID=A0A5N6F846_9EURO|nr:hypothetical protein BDV33DRAFT_199187 [Aspergillus novoparasiticus]
MDSNPRKVERSAYNAFTLRPREFEAYEISSKEKKPGNETYKCHIPHYRVDDSSSVTVVETKNAFEKSLADSSFTQGSFQIAGAVGLGPISGGLKIGGGGGTTDNSGKKELKKEESLMFPRVTIHWDPVCLDVTDECLKDIKKVNNPKTLTEFHNKYGDMFALQIQLGGRLSCSKAKEADSEAKAMDEASKFKAAASASISHAFYQASIEFNREKQSKKTTEESKQNLGNKVAWEATGGDTLLCNNPPQWCASVGQYKWWRVINQDDAVPLYHFLSRFPKVGSEIIERFELSAKDMFDSKKEQENNDRTEDRMKDLDDSLKKKGRQVFQLIEESTGRYMNVAEGTDDIVRFLRGNGLDQALYVTGKIVEDAKKAQACVKLNGRTQDKTSEFMASKRFGGGDKPGLKFREPFHIQSRGHIFHQWLNFDPVPDLWLSKTRNKSYDYKRVVHLSDAPGANCCFWDANKFDNTDYIQDGATVYVGIGVNYKHIPESINWRSIADTAGDYLLSIGGWRADDPKEQPRPLRFTYKTMGIIDVEPPKN